MTSRRMFIGSMLTLAAVAPLLTSCETSSPAEKEMAARWASLFKTEGATVIASDEKKTKIKIRCARCGYTTELEIDTPTADKPYSLEWKCPRCGHKQKIAVKVVPAG